MQDVVVRSQRRTHPIPSIVARLACPTLLISLLPLVLVASPATSQSGDLDEAKRLTHDAAQANTEGRYMDWLRLGERALAIREQVLGPDHPETIESVLEVSQACRGNGDYAKALVLAQRALDARERTAGAHHPDTATALQNLADVDAARGEYATAVPLALRALAIREAALGKRHPDTAASLHCVSELYRSLGDYAQAMPLAQRALQIREEFRGPEHVDTAESLNDLGLLYLEMGDDAQAESLDQRSLAIRERDLGRDHPLTAESVNNLAVLYWRQKDFPRALALFERALQSKERLLGPQHRSTATALNNLAEVYRSTGDFSTAIGLARRAAAIWENLLGPHHPHTAVALNNVAGFYWSMGDYRQAEPLLLRAATIWEQALGTEHPDTARSWNLLAAFYNSKGDYPQALAFYRRALAVQEHTLASVFAVTSEEQKLLYLEKTQGHYLAALSLIQRQFPRDPDAVRFGLELVLRHKGIVLDAQARTRDALAAHLHGDALRQWEQLTTHRAALAKLLLSPPEDQAPADYRRDVVALEDVIAGLERTLGAQSAVVAEELAQRNVTAHMVAARLPPTSTLIEFVVIPEWDEKRLVWMPVSRYVAFVLTSDDRVTLVDLGPSSVVDGQVDDALAAITDPSFQKDLDSYTLKTHTALAGLYQQILQPLETMIGTSGLLIVSPDGELNKVPFAALRTADDHYVVERRTVSYVASGRDLLHERTGGEQSLAMLLVANPAFDDRGVFRSNRVRPRPVVRAADYKQIEYPPLPGTAEEAKVIPPLVAGTKKILVGSAATELAVRTTKSPQILHLATHGFFLKDGTDDQLLPDPLGRGSRHLLRGGAESLLVRSGLLLAGANHADEVTAGDDGILTALEVTDMDLHGTDLVVLSACETALGKIRNGEGVFGLRRAFVLAGARNLMISLWPVNDKFTRDLMERFYHAYAEKVPAVQALRDAELQTIASLRELTSAGAQHRGYAPVTLWAPFILQQTSMK